MISLIKLYLKRDVNLIFVGATPSIILAMEQNSLIKVAGLDHFYPNVFSALAFLKKGLVIRRRSSLRPQQILDISPFFINHSSSEGGSREIAEQVVVEDDADFQVVGDTTAYFRRLSKSSLH